MKKVFMVFLLLTMLSGVSFAQDESHKTVFGGVSLGSVIPYGGMADNSKVGIGVNANLTWVSGKNHGQLSVGYHLFGQKNTVHGAYIPVTLGYYHDFYTVSQIDIYGGIELGSHLKSPSTSSFHNDFQQSYLSFTPAVGGSMKMNNLRFNLDVKFHSLLEDPGPKYFDISVGVGYPIPFMN